MYPAAFTWIRKYRVGRAVCGSPLSSARPTCKHDRALSLTEGFLAVEKARITLRLAVEDLTAANMMVKWRGRLRSEGSRTRTPQWDILRRKNFGGNVSSYSTHDFSHLCPPNSAAILSQLGEEIAYRHCPRVWCAALRLFPNSPWRTKISLSISRTHALIHPHLRRSRNQLWPV